ncbi:MAG: winged helix-turn-helix domain-containing protein [Halobacteria archaeon]|nr:winged helix-turn-helix domain-containing protein [Halobacteria archaeon]
MSKISLSLSLSELTRREFHTEFWSQNFELLGQAVQRIVKEKELTTWSQLPSYLWRNGVDEMNREYAVDMVAFEFEKETSVERLKNLTLLLGSGKRISPVDEELYGTYNTTKDDVFAPLKILSIAGIRPKVGIDVDSRAVGGIGGFFDKLSEYVDLEIEVSLGDTDEPTQLPEYVDVRVKTDPSKRDKYGYWGKREALHKAVETPDRALRVLEEIADDIRTKSNYTEYTYDELQKITDLDRSTLITYTRLLEENNLIDRSRDERRVKISLTDVGVAFTSLVMDISVEKTARFRSSLSDFFVEGLDPEKEVSKTDATTRKQSKPPPKTKKSKVT